MSVCVHLAKVAGALALFSSDETSWDQHSAIVQEYNLQEQYEETARANPRLSLEPGRKYSEVDFMIQYYQMHTVINGPDQTKIRAVFFHDEDRGMFFALNNLGDEIDLWKFRPIQFVGTVQLMTSSVNDMFYGVTVLEDGKFHLLHGELAEVIDENLHLIQTVANTGQESQLTPILDPDAKDFLQRQLMP